MPGKLLAAVSLKTYFGHQATLEWVARAREVSVPWLDAVDVLVVPIATALAPTVELLAGTGILVGAQDCSWAPPGAFTGELPPEVLREVGARVVELGHAERRRLFHEDDATVQRKAAAAARAGLVPMVCVGEPERLGFPAAIRTCLSLVNAALADVPESQPVVVAYEPVWAIGAEEPADALHIRAVCAAIGAHLAGRGPGGRVIYGGTAGPGLFATVYPDVDGLFLGRRAHDIASFAEVLFEMGTLARRDRDRASQLETTL